MPEIRFRDFVVGPPPNDDVLAVAYIRMKQSGILRTVFYESEPDLRWFLEQYGVPNSVVGCWRKDPISDTITFLGMAFVNKGERMGQYSKAEIGFCFMPDGTTIFEKLMLGRAMLQYAFEEFGYDSMFGTTPGKNMAAVAFAKRLGFEIHGPLKDFCVWEGKLCGAYISQISRAVIHQTDFQPPK